MLVVSTPLFVTRTSGSIPTMCGDGRRMRAVLARLVALGKQLREQLSFAACDSFGRLAGVGPFHSDPIGSDPR